MLDDKIQLNDIDISVDRLIGAPEIANFLMCSVRHVRRLSRRDGVPIFKPPGDNRITAFKSELARWQRTKMSP